MRPLDQSNQLQSEAIDKLDAIANEVSAGLITQEEATQKAERIMLELEASTAPLMEEHHKKLRNFTIKTRVLLLVAAAGVVFLLYKLTALFHWLAP